jgi:hypothetical protein
MLRSRFAVVLSALSFLLITSCSGSNSSAPPPASKDLSLSSSTLAFNSVNVGQASSAQTVTLSATGGLGVTISSITLNDTTNYAMTNTCGSQLSLSATCTLSVTFKPQSAVSLPSTITIASNATESPQTITLSGTGTAATQAAVSLSPTTLTFGTVGAGSSSPAQTVTLTNTGNATLSNLATALTGTNAAAFAQTSTCSATLAAGASCTVSVIFTAATEPASATAALSFTDSASSSPQAVSLAGSSVAAVSYALYTFPETDNSVTPLYTLVNNAQKTIDMTMYALEDTTFTSDLVAACNRGVKVRVILDQNDEKSGNTATFNALNAQTNCSAVWANTTFEATHQKSFIVDGTQLALMTLNLQSQYYSTTRDFAMVDNDPVDIAAIEATFNADYAAGTPAGGTAGASDLTYVPGIGDDLIWSPTTAQAAMVNIIANAKKTLLIENEELASSASYILSALETACQNGVQVQLAIVDQSDYESNFTALENAGCGVHVYPDTTTGFYIHAKAVVADHGLPTQSVYMGSINYSNASMNDNRELGMYISDPASVQALYATNLYLRLSVAG